MYIIIRNEYRLYVDIMTVNLLIAWTSLIGQSVHPRGWVKGDGSLFKPATSFTLLEYIIIWYNIQVIINPLLKANKVENLKK